MSDDIRETSGLRKRAEMSGAFEDPGLGPGNQRAERLRACDRDDAIERRLAGEDEGRRLDARAVRREVDCCASLMRAAISDGIIGARAERSPCCTKNPTRSGHDGSADRTSGQTRSGDVATNTGADIHGRDSHRDCCGFGSQPGAGEDASTSEVTRCGRVAA